MIKYTIITPQYNSFELMDKYFETLINQTLKNFEVIIVDDCSTDGSWEKLQKYVKACPLNGKIKLLRSDKNRGPGYARNIGIDIATGEWITFVDNDDWISCNLLERVDEVINREKPNCVIYDYYTYLDGKIDIAHSMYNGEGGRKNISDCMMLVRNHVVGKFYRLNLCKDVRFPNVRRCEDVAYVSQAIVACGNAYYLKEPFYYYRQRPASLSNNNKMDHSDMINAFAILEDKFLVKYPFEMNNKCVAELLYVLLLMMCKAGKSSVDIKKYIEEYEIKYPCWWRCQIIQYLGKPKKLFLMCVRMHFISGIRFIAYLHSLMIKKGA